MDAAAVPIYDREGPSQRQSPAVRRGEDQMQSRTLALFALAGLLLSAGVSAGAAKGEAEKMPGTWKVVSAEDSGRKTPDELIKDLKWTVTKDAITYKVG